MLGESLCLSVLVAKQNATKAQRHKDFTKIGFHRMEMLICCNSTLNKILIYYVIDNKNNTNVCETSGINTGQISIMTG